MRASVPGLHASRAPRGAQKDDTLCLCTLQGVLMNVDTGEAYDGSLVVRRFCKHMQRARREIHGLHQEIAWLKQHLAFNERVIDAHVTTVTRLRERRTSMCRHGKRILQNFLNEDLPAGLAMTDLLCLFGMEQPIADGTPVTMLAEKPWAPRHGHMLTMIGAASTMDLPREIDPDNINPADAFAVTDTGFRHDGNDSEYEDQEIEVEDERLDDD